MGVPSQSDFENFIHLIQFPSFVLAAPSRDKNFDLRLATDAIRAYQDGCNAFSSEIDRHPVSIWLEKSSSASARAWASLFGKKYDGSSLSERELEDYVEVMYRTASRERTFDDYIDDHGVIYRGLTHEEVEKNILAANTPSEVQRRFNSRVHAHLTHNPFDISRGVAIAFLGYFYTDSYKRHYVKATERKEAAMSLRDAIKTLEDEKLWDLCGLEWRVRSPSLPRMEAIERIISSDAKSPIRKLDGTVRERALAFELWSMFRKQFRANKVTAIFNFLLFDGIENPPDSPRSIEKWIKEWKGAGVALNPPQNWWVRGRM